jgi:hypothetical protein
MRTNVVVVMVCKKECTTFILLLHNLTGMRYCIPVLLLVLAVAGCGCTQTHQQPTVPATTVPVSTVPVTTTALPATQSMTTSPVTISGTPVQMQVNVTAWKTDTEIDVQYNGGLDAANLTSLQVHIYNVNNGEIYNLNITAPVTGNIYRFPTHASLFVNSVNVIGTFDNGSQQTVLSTSL